MSGETQRSSRREGTKLLRRPAKAFAVACGVPDRRPCLALLPIGKIASKRQPSSLAKGFGDGDEQRRFAVRSRAVKEADRRNYSGSTRWLVQKAAD
jgi:hypothetical protein